MEVALETINDEYSDGTEYYFAFPLCARWYSDSVVWTLIDTLIW